MNRVIIILLFFLLSTQVNSQSISSGGNVREEVYLHISRSDFIVGETIQLAAYVYSLETGKLSALSSILYVELLDEKSLPVYQTKISLEDGLGNGEYFIPSLLSTGTYHLVAYTRWMKNFGTFFRQPLIIINPYEKPIIPDLKEKKITLDFFPEGGNIIEGGNNKLVVTSNQKNKIINGRIVSDSGDKISDFKIRKNGFGSFYLNPESGKKYQAIIDSENGFDFFEVPFVCSQCIKVSISEKENLFSVSAEGSANLINEVGILEIKNSQNIALTQNIAIGSSVLIFKKDLPAGLLKVTLRSEEFSSERFIYNDRINLENVKIDSSFTTREKVKIDVEIPPKTSYSISVSKVTNQNPQVLFAAGYKINAEIDRPQTSAFYKDATLEDLDNLLITAKWKMINNIKDSVSFLPEIRMDLIDGYVVAGDELTIENVPVCLSIPGEYYQIKVAQTDSKGKFIFNVESPPQNIDGYASVLFDYEKKYEIRLSNEFYESYMPFDKVPFQLDSANISNLITRSINNQIENAYYFAKKRNDSIEKILVTQIDDFTTYRLDEYTRFRTIRDTFIEYIPEVGISKNESNYKFHLIGKYVDLSGDADNRTLLLLDGVPISAKEILEYSPYLIERIDILNKKYFFGSIMVNGVIAFSTYNNNLENHEPVWQKIQLKGVQQQNSEIGLVNNTIKEDNRLPNYNEALYWNPLLYSTAGTSEIEFYTSDLKGDYELRVEGVTDSGEPISLVKYLIVK